eukprot:CAMPEP_0113918212 /NCGR_PEP_ID=MMETSP0780_2-20120614/33211_1 /TAXON_ID=652834 /ORGANISM="Palpitomonas bilix" /LENGTH=59 /DNA_ID=CAMNT_0000917965 /DNA_START=15 /DNA_END=191 /DNA_ORIENTATION=+ /assembly_acc=CAM_ASM_000599
MDTFYVFDEDARDKGEGEGWLAWLDPHMRREALGGSDAAGQAEPPGKDENSAKVRNKTY